MGQSVTRAAAGWQAGPGQRGEGRGRLAPSRRRGAGAGGCGLRRGACGRSFRAMKRIATLLCLALPGVAQAHPHVFVETGFTLIFDDAGRIAAVEIRWRYDELTSLFITEEFGVDADFDGVATEAELAALKGFDLDWPAEFAGDTHITQGGAALALGPPEAGAVDYADGLVTTTHRRALAAPVDPGAGAVVISPYDPSYYTAYEVAWDPVLEGREGCKAELFVPDYEAAAGQLQAALDEVQAGAEALGLEEAEFPPVGDLFAQEIRVTCAAG